MSNIATTEPCIAQPAINPFEVGLGFYYGPYTITKAMGDNYFELNIAPFLGLHPVFNVDLLCPYFPPLLDTSDVAEQLKPTEINLECIQKESSDHIVDTQIKGT
jgi:hypothetical protein